MLANFTKGSWNSVNPDFTILHVVEDHTNVDNKRASDHTRGR